MGKQRVFLGFLLVLLALLLAHPMQAQLGELRAKQRNDQKIGLDWFYKGEDVSTSLERKENVVGAVYEKIADIHLSDEGYVDEYNLNPNSGYIYRFTHNGDVYQISASTYDFSVFELLPPRNVFFYKLDGNVHLFWTDVSHREDSYLVMDEASNVLDSLGINETHVVLEDEGWETIYVVAREDGIKTEKVPASQIEVIDFDNELTEEEPLVEVCPNWPYKDGVKDMVKNVDGNVSGFIDFLVQDSSLRNEIDIIKLYSQVHVLSQATIQKLVDFQNTYDKMIAIELGGVRQRSTDNKAQAGEVCAARDIQIFFYPIYNAGGRVDYIETDNSILFTAWGGHAPSPSVTNPLNFTISEVAKEQADYFAYIHQFYPDTKLGAIENLRGNHFGEWKGKKNPVGCSQKGLEDYLFQLNVQMRSQGLRLDYFNAELAYQDMFFGFDDFNYKKLKALSNYLDSLGIKLAKLYNPHGSISSDAEFFHSAVQFYNKAKGQYGLKTGIDVFQSWIAYPTTIYGDSDPYSFTSILKTIYDKEAPAIISPSTLTAPSDTGICGAQSAAILSSPECSDNFGVLSIKNDAPAVFPIGETQVTWRVSDVAGHVSTALQTVHVSDHEPPLITPPSSPVNISVGPGIPGADSTGVLGRLLCSDNCGIQSVSNDAPDLFPLGTTVVTWTVSDIHGNESTAVQTVQVSEETSRVDQSANSKLLVYPNPVEEELHIRMGIPLESVKLYSISGSVMSCKYEVGSSEFLLDVSGMSDGLYLLEVATGEGSMVQKIVKN